MEMLVAGKDAPSVSATGTETDRQAYAMTQLESVTVPILPRVNIVKSVSRGTMEILATRASVTSHVMTTEPLYCTVTKALLAFSLSPSNNNLNNSTTTRNNNTNNNTFSASGSSPYTTTPTSQMFLLGHVVVK